MSEGRLSYPSDRFSNVEWLFSIGSFSYSNNDPLVTGFSTSFNVGWDNDFNVTWANVRWADEVLIAPNNPIRLIADMNIGDGDWTDQRYGTTRRLTQSSPGAWSMSRRTVFSQITDFFSDEKNPSTDIYIGLGDRNESIVNVEGAKPSYGESAQFNREMSAEFGQFSLLPGQLGFFARNTEKGAELNSQILQKYADDPPRFDYHIQEPVDDGGSPFDQLSAAYGASYLAMDAAFAKWSLGIAHFEAALPTLERMQGAYLEEDYVAYLRQSDHFSMLVSDGDRLLLEAAADIRAAAPTLRNGIEADPSLTQAARDSAVAALAGQLMAVERALHATTFTSVVMNAVGALPGDFNADGVVDAADYSRWRDGLGGEFRESDYSVWRANFGAHQAFAVGKHGDAPGVPEPACWQLASLAALGALFDKRRRKTG